MKVTEEWLSKKIFDKRGLLSPAELPKEIHRQSWAHGYQAGLYEAVKYGSWLWFFKMKRMVRKREKAEKCLT